MSNLPLGAGQQLERAANTAYVAAVFGPWREMVAYPWKLSPGEGLASHQLDGEVTAHHGLDG